MTIEPVLAARFSKVRCRWKGEAPASKLTKFAGLALRNRMSTGARSWWKIQHFSIYAFYRKDNVKRELSRK